MINFIIKDQKQFKANLHSHSVLSDGTLGVDEMVQAYKNHGYSVLAITDHEASYDHTDKSTEDFLMITGYEAYIRPSQDCVIDHFGPEIHMNLLAKEPHNTTLIGFDPKFCKYLPAEEIVTRKKLTDLGARRYDRGYIQAFINEARANGYLVSYNHPCWSMEAQEEILSYDGFFSLEIFNTGSMTINGFEYNMALYDQLLRRGKLIPVHGADDNHNKHPFDDLLCDSFGAWTMIIAPELSYSSVITALENGSFYASTGVDITALSFDGNKVHLECSEAQRIIMHLSPKLCYNAYNKDGSPIFSADFDIPDRAPYVYFSVLDGKGHSAQTRAFSRKELGI
jgi:hypothetical protein